MTDSSATHIYLNYCAEIGAKVISYRCKLRLYKSKKISDDSNSKSEGIKGPLHDFFFFPKIDKKMNQMYVMDEVTLLCLISVLAV